MQKFFTPQRLRLLLALGMMWPALWLRAETSPAPPAAAAHDAIAESTSAASTQQPKTDPRKLSTDQVFNLAVQQLTTQSSLPATSPIQQFSAPASHASRFSTQQVDLLTPVQITQPAPPPMEAVPTPPAAPPLADAAAVKLDDLEALALANNPTLAQASANVRALQGKYWQEGRYPNPRVMYKGDEIGDENAAGFQGVSAIQEIVTSHKLSLAQNVVSGQIAEAQQNYAAQEFRVRNDVKLRFYEVLLAQEALKLNLALQGNTQSAVQAADDLFKAAEVGRADVLQAKVENDLVQLQSVKARNAFESAWRRLAAVVGMPEMQSHPLAGDVREAVPSVTWEDAWAHISSASPELSAAQARVDAARWAVQKACADRCPNWEIEGGYAHDNATSFDTGLIAVTVPLPIFNRNQGNIRAAQAQLNAAEAEVETLLLQLRSRLAQVFERYGNARELVDRYQNSILPNTKESLELSTARYRAGEINFTGLLLTQRTALQTQVAYLEALREVRETSILLDGLLLADSLQTGAR